MKKLWSLPLMAALALALTGCPAPAPAAAPAGQIVVDGAWARAATAGMHSAAYLVIRNGGAEDTLVSAQVEGAMPEIHETVQAAGGMMQMQPLANGLKVPANGSVSLQPGGYHIMLMGLKQDLKLGGELKLKLVFKSGKTMDVTAKIQEMPMNMSK